MIVYLLYHCIDWDGDFLMNTYTDKAIAFEYIKRKRLTIGNHRLDMVETDLEEMISEEVWPHDENTGERVKL